MTTTRRTLRASRPSSWICINHLFRNHHHRTRKAPSSIQPTAYSIHRQAASSVLTIQNWQKQHNVLRARHRHMHHPPPPPPSSATWSPPDPAPLQVPQTPLFDPTGLSASLSADDWASFDLSSPAAARLGIASPSSAPAIAPAFAPLRSVGHTEGGDDDDADRGAATRGSRRRYSSAKSKGNVTGAGGTSKSRLRMWWERGQPSSSGSASDSGSGSASASDGEVDDSISRARSRSRSRSRSRARAATSTLDDRQARISGMDRNGSEATSACASASTSASSSTSPSARTGRPALSLQSCTPALLSTSTPPSTPLPPPPGLGAAVGGPASRQAGSHYPAAGAARLSSPSPHRSSHARQSSSPNSSARSPSPAGSNSVRSPAADFLSAFSSMNSVVASPPPLSAADGPWGSASLSSLEGSPRRNAHAYGASAPDTASAGGSRSRWHGLGGAAQQLYASLPSPTPLRADDENARIGEGGRYLLGRVIGFGGFSTVREGWDLGPQGDQGIQNDHANAISSTGSALDLENRQRVAIKIFYSDLPSPNSAPGPATTSTTSTTDAELSLWRSLPLHTHLLPLLDHVSLGTLGSALVMPLCARGSLLDFVRSEGGRRTGIARGVGDRGPPPAIALAKNLSNIDLGQECVETNGSGVERLSRSASLHASLSGTNVNPGLRRENRLVHKPRIASGSALPVSARSPSVSGGGMSLSPTCSSVGSVSALGASGLRRRASSRIGGGQGGVPSRSQGVPLRAAAEVMKQLASAMLCLHTKAHVLHGDLKLENVLGQTRNQRQHSLGTKMKEREGDSHSIWSEEELEEGGSSSQAERTDVPESEVPDWQSFCWRVADFGLARRIDPLSPAPDRGGASNSMHGTHTASHQSKAIGPGGTFPRSAGRHGSLAQSEAQGEPNSWGNPRPGTSRAILGHGGSLAYTPPEALRSDSVPMRSSPPSPSPSPPLEDKHDSAGESAAETAPSLAEVSSPLPSPFAADMWALGCILYALLSGRLPFSDSFEPRLQLKIAQARWEMPARLLRRAEQAERDAATSGSAGGASRRGRAGTASSGLTTLAGEMRPSPSMGTDMATWGSNAGPFARPEEEAAAVESRSVGQHFRVAFAAGIHGLVGNETMSASLPTLPSRISMHGQAREGRESADEQLPLASDSSSSRPAGDTPADAGVHADADADPGTDAGDSDWDGTSGERAAAREVLGGLLNPDPALRWTVERLAACKWLTGAFALDQTARQEQAQGVGLGLASLGVGAGPKANEVDADGALVPEAPAAHQRPSLVGQSISEHASQEHLPPSRTGHDAEYEPITFERRPTSRSPSADPADPIRQRSSRRSSSLARSRPTDLPPEPRTTRSTSAHAPKRSGAERSRSTGQRSSSPDMSGFSQLAVSTILPGRRPFGHDRPPPDAQSHSHSRERERGRNAERMADLLEDSPFTAFGSSSRSASNGAGDLPARPIPIQPSREYSQSRSRSRSGRAVTRSPEERDVVSYKKRSPSRGRQKGPARVRIHEATSSPQRAGELSHDASPPHPQVQMQVQAPSQIHLGYAPTHSSTHSRNRGPPRLTEEPRPVSTTVHAQRNSTSRSRSRAPDALTSILRESAPSTTSSGSGSGSRSVSVSRSGNGNANGKASGRSRSRSQSRARLDVEEEMEGEDDAIVATEDGAAPTAGVTGQWWERGRNRDRMLD